MAPVVIGLFGVVILGIIALVIVGPPIRFPPPPQPQPSLPPIVNGENKKEVISPTPAANSSLPPVPPSPPSKKTPDIESKLVVEPKKSSDPNIGILKESLMFSDRLISQDQERTYFFTIDKPSNVSLYLDNVTNELAMWLYVDTNGNGVIDSGEQIDSASAYSNSTGAINRTLGPDRYIATVRFKGGNSNYNLQVVNNTHDAINVGALQERKSFSDTVALNRQNRKKYYFFSLKSTSNVNIVLNQVTNEVGMWLYVDTNGNGVIDSGEQIDSASAYSNSAGTIKRSLGADNYILVVLEKGGNTNSTVTMTAQ